MFALPVAGQLPAFKSHAARRWQFMAAADCTSPSLGTVTVVQGKRDVVSYGVAVEEGQVLFAKLDGSAVYGVTVTRTVCPPAAPATASTSREVQAHGHRPRDDRRRGHRTRPG